jgi:uncharacterized protein (TIGR02391 family)
MPRQRLDPNLLEKMAGKSGKSTKYLREQISRRASRQSITSTAAQLAWAKELKIGVANALGKVSADVREEVRSVGSAVPTAARMAKAATPKKQKVEPITAATIRRLLQDKQLQARCADLLRAKKHFDRAFREATTVLDNRLKTKTGIKNMNPENLVSKAINPDPTRAVIEISPEKAEQEGFHSLCKGIMLAFRNPAHHSLSEKFTREDALKFCGFVDAVLGVIEQSTIHPERT